MPTKIKIKVLRHLEDPVSKCSTLNCKNNPIVETSIGYQCLDHFVLGPLNGHPNYEWDETPGEYTVNGVKFESLGFPNGSVRMVF